MSAQPDRLPPSSREHERALLSSILRDPTIVDEALMEIHADDFYVVGHQCIFSAMASMAEAGKLIDLLTVADWLTANEAMDEIGGHGYLAELWDAAPSAAHWRQYCEIIRDLAMRRNLLHASNEAIRKAFDLGTPAMEIVGTVESQIAGITERGLTSEAVDLQAALRETYERIDARRGQSEMTGIPTGYVDLDAMTCGLQASELVIVGARPSQGKTALTLNIVRNACVEHGKRALFVSLEQGRTELAERLICLESQVDSHHLRTGHISTDEQERMFQANERLSSAKLIIDDRPQQTMTYIGASARRAKRKHGIELVVIDYLQLIDVDDRRMPRQEQVANISRRMKLLARELKMPVVCVAQLNRGVEDRAGSRPRLSDLRESGAIEQDADTVMLLHRESEPHEPAWAMEVNVAKNRNGKTGAVSLMFHRPTMRFHNQAMQ